jgi:hypothetical protein
VDAYRESASAMHPFIPNSNPNLFAVLVTQETYTLCPIIYWAEWRYSRQPVPAALISASLSDLHHMKIAVFDRGSGHVFAPGGAVYSSPAAYWETRK